MANEKSWVDPFVPSPVRSAPTPVKILVLAGEVYGVYKGAKYLNNKFNPTKNQETVTSVKTEADEILKNNLHLPSDQQTIPSYSKSQYKTYADTLFTAMDGSGTDEDALDGVFKKMNNDLDILYLIEAFGTRAGTSMFASSTPTDLPDWLVSDGVVTRVNDLLKTKAKITKSF